MTDRSLPDIDWRVVFNRATPPGYGIGDACAPPSSGARPRHW